MVSLRSDLPRAADGAPDLKRWVQTLEARRPAQALESLQPCAELLAQSVRAQEIEEGVQIAELMMDLKLDDHALVAALCYRAVRTGQLALTQLDGLVDREALLLLEGVQKMASVRLLRLSNTRLQTTEASDQISNIRSMITALIDDVRVALLKLGERVVVLRAAKNATRQRQIRIAEECHRIFAPLAGRLGVWHLKWELEDLGLRYLDPDAYRSIAAQLDGRRAEREAKVRAVADDLQELLEAAGLEAQVKGRAKHIYSIWRKMQAKALTFEEVYDVRAVRVLLPDIAQCYAALGIIHTRWQHVPKEFDDYIAVPKENGYRSIHTAVRTDSGKALEVQLRTLEMHEEAELGVCAHWAYKDQSGGEHPYRDKLDWLRQTLEWADARSWTEGLDELLEPTEDDQRVFVFTPGGHVIDLIQGATALDLAYRVHTEVGHSCIGAQVDGIPVSLLRPLRSGERVEILTGEQPAPAPLWLEHSLGYVRTARAREKVREFWRSAKAQLRTQTVRALLERCWQQLGWPRAGTADWLRLANRFGYAALDGFELALACGELSFFDVVSAFAPEAEPGDRALQRYQVRLMGENRHGLLRDVALLLSELRVPLLSTVANGESAEREARMQLTIRSQSNRETLRVLIALREVPGVRLAELEHSDRHTDLEAS